MIKRQFILLLSIVLGSIGLNAQPRSEAAAMEMAKQFLGEEARARGTAQVTNRLTLVSPEAIGRIIRHDTPKAVTRGVTPNNGFYVFNDERSSRFVIVSGDERQEEVLGYSENELFTTEDIPCGLAYMLSEYHREYQYLSEQEPTASSRAMMPKSVMKKAAAYTSCILKTNWGQGTPYNKKCNGNAAGCVAIAMAQIMYYHKYPSTYSWSDMLTSYSSGYTAKQADAVAKLVRECGDAVKMKYGKDGSSAKQIDAAWALAHQFSYNPNIKFYKKDYFSPNEWENIILNELSNKRPIIYGGDNGKSGNAYAGHAFILDGYDGNGFYHFNWGWNGSGVNPSYGNGGKSYFKLSSLKPKDASTHDYTYSQEMVCQISKQTFGNFECVFYADNFIVNNFTLGNSFKVSFKNLFCYCTNANSFNSSFNGRIGIQVYNTATLKSDIWSHNIEEKATYGYNNKDYNFTINKNDLKDGTYYIYPCVFSHTSNGIAQNITQIRTKNTQYDYYLATVKNGKVTLKLKPDPTPDPTPQPDIVAKPKISVSNDVVTITCSTSGATIYYDCSYKDYDGKYYDDIKNATYSKGFYLLGNAKIRAWAKKGGKQSEYAEHTVNDFKASKPVISVNGNTITITCSTKDAFISYTTDGRTPDPSDYKMDYIDPFTCTTATTIKAIAYYPYWNLSDMATLSFKPTEKLKLTASPASGQVTKGTKVTLTAKTTSGTTISGANIYYTLNGTTPTTSSTKYTSTGITISEACTLKAKAYKDGYEASDVLTEKYTISSNPSPNITLSSLVCDKTNLTQSDKLVLNATFKNTGTTHNLKTKLCICTTTDDGPSIKYSGPEVSKQINQNGTVTIKYEYDLANVTPGTYVATVIYYKDWDDNKWYYSKTQGNLHEITVSKSKEKLKLTASPASGQVTKGTKVTLTAKTTSGTTISGANIYYTLNGTTPTTSSTKYTSTGITISEACTLKAKAYKDGYEASDVLTEKYTITPPSTITITAKSHTREYGNTNPTFAFEVTGGKISGTPKISCSATKTSAVGTYNIIVEKGSVQGDVKLVNGSLTITKAPLTVRANDCERMEGENNPTFTLSYSGWKNGENESVITKPTATTTATKSSPSGTYIIKVSGGSAKNYDFKYIDGTLTIKKSNTIAINAANFPDANFRDYILAQNYGKDGNLTESEIKEVTEMNVSFKKISSLIGIEYFSSLTKLDCNNNKLSSIDISKNTAMKYLNCDYNQITTLNVSNNTELEMLDCSYNQLSKLVVSKNGKLSSLDCKNNQINGIAMDNLIESLPSTKYGFFYVVNSSDENNVCTKSQVAKAKSKGWKAKYWNGSKYLDYDGEEPNFELADGERYYIKNKANGLFISCGGNWGTHIMVDSRGLDLLLKKAKDNVHWIIETNFRTTISDSGGAIGEEGYVDNYVNTELTIKNVQDNVFSIAAPNGKYLAINNSGNSVYFGASSASGKEAQWEFISEKDILAQRKASLQNASASNPVDATFLIKGANINRFDKRIENWYYRRDDDCVFNVNWGCSVEDTEPIFEVFRSDNYYCYGVYTHYQRINLIPGKYKLEAQGFYRDGDYSVAEKARSNGKEKIYAFLFAGDNKVAFKSIFDEASSYAKKGWSTKTKHGYIPDTMNEAGYTFQTGAYNNVLEFTVTKEIEIEIGVAIEESYTLNNWTTIDNFQLTYYGTKATDVKTAKAERQDNAIYSLSGQRLAAPKKGLNIIGGKKVVVH